MNTLPVAADAPLLLRAGAATLLVAHIAGGTMAILSGAVALAARKGSRLHSRAGKTFFVSMLVMASIGGVVSLFLVSRQGDPKYFDSLAGFFTFYLVVTGWMTMQRRPGTVGRAEVAAFVYVALLVTAAVLLGRKAGDHGLVGGYPSSSYFGFAGIFALAAVLDIKVLLTRGVTGASRLARHLWRMCLAMFVATGSFFLGQQRVMPEAIQGSPWLSVPPLAVLAIMVLWLLRLQFLSIFGYLKKRLRNRRRQAGPGAPVPLAS